MIADVFEELKAENLFNLDVDQLLRLVRPNRETVSLLSLNLIDKDLLNEVKTIVHDENISIYFGKSLRDIKCVIKEDNSERKHELFIYYVGPKKLTIAKVNLPYSPLQEKEYRTIGEIATAYKNYLNNLSSYFYELEGIDRVCSVMEPLNPTFKDDYRRILLDDRTWLHVEVTTAGLATNIHLIGQSDLWHDKLQSGLLSWDHDIDIVENIMSVFDLTEFPVLSNRNEKNAVEDTSAMESPTCGICLCDDLPNDVGLPLPLCQNPKCGVYFHRSCLYQAITPIAAKFKKIPNMWLVACSGNRPPAFGVANGACPTCLLPIACSEKDN